MSNEKKDSQVKLNPDDLKNVSGGTIKVVDGTNPVPTDPSSPDAVVCSKCKKPLTSPDELKNKMCKNCYAQFRADLTQVSMITLPVYGGYNL